MTLRLNPLARRGPGGMAAPIASPGLLYVILSHPAAQFDDRGAKDSRSSTSAMSRGAQFFEHGIMADDAADDLWCADRHTPARRPGQRGELAGTLYEGIEIGLGQRQDKTHGEVKQWKVEKWTRVETRLRSALREQRADSLHIFPTSRLAEGVWSK